MTVNATKRVFKIVGGLFVIPAILIIVGSLFGGFDKELPNISRPFVLIIGLTMSLPFWFMAAACYWFYYILEFVSEIKDILLIEVDFKEKSHVKVKEKREELDIEQIRRKAREHIKSPSFS